MTIKNVTIVGANGRLGPAVLSALLSANTFAVTVLSRSSSKSTYPDSVKVIRVADEFPLGELTHALQGQDAVIVTTAGSNDDLQIRLADAAVQAGVQRFIPADFGSCDSSDQRALDLLPLYRAKKKVREHLQKLAGSDSNSGGSLSWTSLVCGHFFDYGLTSGLLHFDLEQRVARLLDGGEIKFSATTIPTIGSAVVRVLQHPDATRNRMLYIQSFCVTQRQIFKSLEKVTRQKWHDEQLNSEEFVKENMAVLDQNPDDEEARENVVSVLGITDANWESKDGFANQMLGLEDEDLEQVIRKVVQQ